MNSGLRTAVEYLPVLLSGLWMSVLLILASLCVGTVIGAVVCLGRMSGPGPARACAKAFIGLMRGLPETVIVFLIYYGGPFLFKAKLSAFESGVVALGVPFAAFVAEVFRTGLNAVPKGQIEAAKALGLPRRRVLQHVWAPQAFRVSLPPFLGIVTVLIKNSALISAISVEELFYQVSVIAAREAKYLEMITIAAALYFMMIAPLSLASRFWEGSRRRPARLPRPA